MKNISLTLLLFFVFFSCNRKEKPFFRGELKKIHFKNEYQVEEEQIKIDSVGNFRVHVVGDYLVISTYKLAYFTKIYNKNTREYLGDFFRNGNGPEDFLQFSIMTSEQGQLTVNDRQTKQLKIIDLNQTIEEKNTQIQREFSYTKVVDPILAFYVSDSCLLVKDFDLQTKGLYYLKYNPQTDVICEDPILLYNYPVNSKIRNKVASIADCMKPDGTKLAVVTGRFDHFDIVDVQDPENNIAVTTADKVKKNSYLLEEIEIWEMPNYYRGFPFCTDELIFICYYDYNKKENNHEIHAMDWDGNPKFKLIVPRSLMSLTVDFDDGTLYGLSGEYLYRYDIKDILAKY